MQRVRVIPVVLVDRGRAVKTRRFRNPVYLGDPINIVRVFNHKEVDELIVLDIGATRAGNGPDFELAEALASECFMPLSFGGGIRKIDHAQKLFTLGVDKVTLNTALDSGTALLSEIAEQYGRQAVVASIDVKMTWSGKYRVMIEGGRRRAKRSLGDLVQSVARAGAGEILVNSIDHDGCRDGYDVDLIRSISTNVNIPVIACGGAGKLDDFRLAITEGGASAVAAGSVFVLTARTGAVLISYPSQTDLEQRLFVPVQEGG